jgi:hypothetical protein
MCRFLKEWHVRVTEGFSDNSVGVQRMHVDHFESTLNDDGLLISTQPQV